MKKLINVSMFVLVAVFSVSSSAGVLDAIANGITGAATAVAGGAVDLAYVDNGANLYCEVTCKCDDEVICGAANKEVTFGDYFKDAAGANAKIPGRWIQKGDDQAWDSKEAMDRFYLLDSAKKTKANLAALCGGLKSAIVKKNSRTFQSLIETGMLEASVCMVESYAVAKLGLRNYPIVEVTKKTPKSEL